MRYGYRRIHVLLRREGWPINVKRVHRLYRMDGLNLRAKRPRRHVMAARGVERPLATRPNEIWAMDFVSDALLNGKRFRSLTVVDAYTRECLAIHVDQGIKGEQVVDVMDRLLFQWDTPPDRIRVDNWPRVYFEGPGSLGLHQPSDPGLLPARQADRTMRLWNRSTVGSATNG